MSGDNTLPLVNLDAPGKRGPCWSFKERREQFVITNTWCIPVPLIPSPTTNMATILTHLKAPTAWIVDQGSLNSLLEQFSWTSVQINHMIDEEEERVACDVVPANQVVTADDSLSSNLWYIIQFPSDIGEAKYVMMENYKATWIIEYSRNIWRNAREYLHTILQKGGFLAEGRNLMDVVEEEEIRAKVEDQRRSAPGGLLDGVRLSNFPMRFLLWNCKDAGTGAFRSNFMALVGRHMPNIVCVTETRMSMDRARCICGSLSFERCFMADPYGFGGGFWILWDPNEVQVDVIVVSQQEIHASVQAARN